VLDAIKVMYAGAVFSVLDIIIDLADQSATKTAIKKKSPHLSLHSLNTIMHFAVIGDVAVGVLGALLFIWIARSCRSGKNWAQSPQRCSVSLASWARSTTSSRPRPR
jgi:hypothetical protein